MILVSLSSLNLEFLTYPPAPITHQTQGSLGSNPTALPHQCRFTSSAWPFHCSEFSPSDFTSLCVLALAHDILLHVIVIVYICLPQNIPPPCCASLSSHPRHQQSALGLGLRDHCLKWRGKDLAGVELSDAGFLAEAFCCFVRLSAMGHVQEVNEIRTVCLSHYLFQKKNHEKRSWESLLQTVKATICLLWFRRPCPSCLHASKIWAAALALDFSKGDARKIGTAFTRHKPSRDFNEVGTGWKGKIWNRNFETGSNWWLRSFAYRQ